MKKHYIVRKIIESNAEFCKLANIDISTVLDIKRSDLYKVGIPSDITYSENIYSVIFKTKQS